MSFYKDKERKQVYLSLGGNEGEVLLRLKKALHLLSIHPDVLDITYSHFYRTSPMEVESLVWFVNVVCSFQTSMTLQKVFKMTQMIEVRLGKINKPKNASRPIDIDLLFYGHQISKDQELEIPHPRWKERLFVLIPLKDLTNEIVLQKKTGWEHDLLKDLIDPLLDQMSQTVSLLEKNPNLQ